jgi:hypothetical protein
MNLTPLQRAGVMIGTYVGAGAVAAIATRAIESKVEQPGQNGIVDKLGIGAGIGAAGLTFMGPAFVFNYSGSIAKTAILGGLLGSYVGASILGDD